MLPEPVKIETQAQLDRILEPIDWDQTVLRRFWFESPEEVLPTGIVAWGFPGTLIMEFAIGVGPIAGIRLIFHEVEHAELPVNSDIQARGTVKHDRVYVEFGGAGDRDIVARSLVIEYLDQSCWKPRQAIPGQRG